MKLFVGVLTTVLLISGFINAADCYPPIINNAPSDITENHCNLVSYDFDADLDPLDDPGNTITFSCNIGDINPTTGYWSYTPTGDDVNTPPTLEVTVSNDSCEQTYYVPLIITNNPPEITNCDTYIQMSINYRYPVFTFEAYDDPCDSLKWFVFSFNGVGEVSIDSTTGALTVFSEMDGLYEVGVGVTDYFDTTYCFWEVEVLGWVSPFFAIETIGDIFPGLPFDINIYGYMGNYTHSPGKVDLLLAYDKKILSLLDASFIDDWGVTWEYYYELKDAEPYDFYNPIGLIRLVGIPDSNSYSINGNIINLRFLITHDEDANCSFLPLRFYWDSCENNTFTDRYFNTVFISDFIFNNTDFSFEDDISDTTVGYPTFFGAQEKSSCSDYETIHYSRSITFINGGLMIPCYDNIDSRGDIDIDGRKYTIADATLFANYFIYGLSVFDPALQEASIAESDMNADGLTLSPADLMFLIRIVSGDAFPYPKLAPVTASLKQNNGVVSIDKEMGAAFIIAEGNVTPELLADNMTIGYSYDETNDETRILVYSMEQGHTFINEFIRLNSEIKSIEFATYDGAVVKLQSLPTKFELHQNYPNPFNPVTNISFSLPEASDVNLSIFNINGQKIVEFTGSYEAGNHSIEWNAQESASGIYFYKITASSFTDVKKMILLK